MPATVASMCLTLLKAIFLLSRILWRYCQSQLTLLSKKKTNNSS